MPTCARVPTTPVFTWDPVPGASYYHLTVAQDQNFTTSEMPAGVDTSFPMVALRLGDQRSTLPESQAGSAYYWHVEACGTNGCTTSPVSRFPPLPGSEAFRKASPGVTGLSTSDPSASEISFSWQDYYDTNVATSWGGESGNQTARTYRIQVSPDPWSPCSPTPPPSTRPPSRPATGCTPTARTTGGCRLWTRTTSA